MSFYAASQISHRTAGYIPGVTSLSHSPADMPSPTSRVSAFDTLLQEDMATRSADSPPFSSTQRRRHIRTPQTDSAAPVAGRHTYHSEFNAKLNAGFRTPAAPDAAQQAFKNAGESRTAGRTVATPDRASFTADGKKQSFSLWDLVDIINPLQHIPLISQAYRAITGDEINPPARIFGGALYGGPVGAGFSIAGAIFNDISTGNETAGPVMAYAAGADGAVAQNAPEFSIHKDDIIWSQPQNADSPPRSAILAANETHHAGSAAALSPSPLREAASRPFPILSQTAPTHTHPTHGDATKARPSVSHSLHHVPNGRPLETATPMSIASQEEERNRKEISYAGQENAGSPLFPALHEIRAEAQGRESAPGSTAPPKDLHVKMMAALDKYRAMKSLR